MDQPPDRWTKYRERGRGPSSAALALLIASGCFGGHEAVAPDGGSDPRTDAGSTVDGGPSLLPPEPEPDLGPDSRPSDYPDADAWEDPPDLGPDEPCCVLSEPLEVIAREPFALDVSSGPPRIARGPDGWGLLLLRNDAPDDPTAGPVPVLFHVSRDATSIRATRDLTFPSSDGEMVEALALEYAAGRWAIGYGGLWPVELDGRVFVRLYDRALTPATDWAALAHGTRYAFDLVRMAVGSSWVGVEGIALGVTAFDESGAYEVARTRLATGTRLHGVSSRSRIIVLAPQSPGWSDESRVFVLGGPPDYRALGFVALRTTHSAASALGALRDRAIAVLLDEGVVQVEVIDPFDVSIVGERHTIATVPVSERSPPLPGQVDVAGSSRLGLAATCYGVASDDAEPSRIVLQVVGVDGRPHGAAMTIAGSEGLSGSTRCAIAAADDGFLVAWDDGESIWVRRADVAR